MDNVILDNARDQFLKMFRKLNITRVGHDNYGELIGPDGKFKAFIDLQVPVIGNNVCSRYALKIRECFKLRSEEFETLKSCTMSAKVFWQTTTLK